MSKKLKRLTVLLMSILMLASALSTSAFAEGKVDTRQPCVLTIDYNDGAKPVPNARFSAFRLADVDEYGMLTLTEDFEKYRNTVSGLSDLENLTEEQWRTLASTLRGYVLRDRLSPEKEGKTDSDGVLPLTDLPVGLYLVLGNRATTDDFYTYTSVPFMALLPGRNSEANEWNYEVTASPKYTKDFNPPDEDDDFITRKVLKKWDDEGYESIRPTEVVVQLLRDGVVFDTQTLNKDNNWRYAWDNLDSDHTWDLIEKEMEDYAVSIDSSGITFTVSNKYVVPIVPGDPPVLKRIIGDTPKTNSTFTFVMSGKDVSCPMPPDSNGTVKEITITGAGSAEFGEMIFTKPGTYEYTIREKNTGVEGYTYDTTVYSLIYEVTEKDGELTAVSTIHDNKGKEASVLEFTNSYKTPGNKLPQTGSLWWPVPILIFLGTAFVSVGLACRRKGNR